MTSARRSRTRGDLEVSHATVIQILDVTNRRRLRFDVLKGGLALGARALRLIAAPAHQLDVTDCAVAAQMTRDGVIVNGADTDADFDGAAFLDMLGHSFP